MAEIRVLIADDHAMLRSGLKLLINTQTDMKVIGEAGDFCTTREKVFELHPDVAAKASFISPHDNHVGQITTALSLYNTALCALWQRGLRHGAA